MICFCKSGFQNPCLTDKILIRNRSGIWGWRSDKNEIINGYDCKVYTANNLQLVTKTRVEHLNSESARTFLNEFQETDSANQNKQGNGSLPGFLNNFFQGNQQQIKVFFLFILLKNSKSDFNIETCIF